MVVPLEAFWLDVTTSKDECTWTRLTSVVFTRKRPFTEENRTFNLGRVFVTATSYKNRSVESNKTGQYPVFLGPLCLHYDAEQSTYHKFFSHLRDQLNTDELNFGSDDEKALRNAIKTNFPQSGFLLCTKNVKDNIRNYLQQSGCSQNVREQ